MSRFAVVNIIIGGAKNTINDPFRMLSIPVEGCLFLNEVEIIMPLLQKKEVLGLPELWFGMCGFKEREMHSLLHDAFIVGESLSPSHHKLS